MRITFTFDGQRALNLIGFLAGGLSLLYYTLSTNARVEGALR